MTVKRLWSLTALGLLVLQVAWIFAMPPFRGSDEFDHAFRAAGVADGVWAPKHVVDDGRGQVVRVPGALVAAASAQCAQLSYTHEADCHPIPGSTRADGTVEVTTSAGSYDPLLYALMGYVAKPFYGSTSLYVMRVVAALLCWGLTVASYAALARRRARPWTLVGLLAALTPTTIYTMALPAPNGLEIAAGLGLWCGLIGLLEPEDVDERVDKARPRRWLWALCAASGFLLMFLRTLGPLWLVLIVVLCAAQAGLPAVRDAVTRGWRGSLLAILSVVVGAGVALGWKLADRGLQGSPLDAVSGHESLSRAFQIPVWTFQMVDAIPLRNTPGPIAVYPLAFSAVVALVIAAWRRGTRREAAVVAIGVLLTLLLPVLLTLATMKSQGVIWQGRYVMPFSVGLLPLCGVVLDRAGWRVPAAMALQLVCVAVLAVAGVAATVAVVVNEGKSAVSTHHSGWLEPAPIVIAIAVALAWVLLAGILLRLVHTVGLDSESSHAA